MGVGSRKKNPSDRFERKFKQRLIARHGSPTLKRTLHQKYKTRYLTYCSRPTSFSDPKLDFIKNIQKVYRAIAHSPEHPVKEYTQEEIAEYCKQRGIKHN